VPVTPAEPDAPALEALARELIDTHTNDLEPDERLGKVSRYLDGDQDPPYTPKGANREFRSIAEKSITNWLPLISDTFSKGLFVDGYRHAGSADNAKAWSYWQANGLDARQTVVHRGALEYGTSYVLVLPSEGKNPEYPTIRPISPLKATAFYQDDDDEWPEHALIMRGETREGTRLFEVLDDTYIHYFSVEKDHDEPALTSSVEHGMGVCPIVRFRNRLDGEAKGIIRPLFRLQDRINEAVFTLLVALQYASFRQRWATGLAIPVDDQETIPDPANPGATIPNPNLGKPLESFNAAVNRLWVSDSPEAKFGDFSQTEVTGHLSAYGSAVKTLAALAQTPPHVLLGDLVNLSADALAAAEASTQRKTEEYETIFGEAWEQVFRLAAYAQGDAEAFEDTGAQVRWRDTEARSLAATVDALGKMAQMLHVPFEALWERIPGVTDTDVQTWREMAKDTDGIRALADALAAAGQANTEDEALGTEAPPPAAAPLPPTA